MKGEPGFDLLELSTQRLILREFVADDWSPVLAYQQDPRYLRFYPWVERSEADAKAFVGMFLDQQREIPRRRFQLAVTLKESGVLIGSCGIRRKPDNDWEADIGYELAPKHWGCGYATEAAQSIVNFGFSARRTTAPQRVLQRPLVGYPLVRTAAGRMGRTAARAARRLLIPQIGQYLIPPGAENQAVPLHHPGMFVFLVSGGQVLKDVIHP